MSAVFKGHKVRLDYTPTSVHIFVTDAFSGSTKETRLKWT